MAQAAPGVVTGHEMDGSDVPRSFVCQTFDHDPAVFHAPDDAASAGCSKWVGSIPGTYILERRPSVEREPERHQHVGSRLVAEYLVNQQVRGREVRKVLRRGRTIRIEGRCASDTPRKRLAHGLLTTGRHPPARDDTR